MCGLGVLGLGVLRQTPYQEAARIDLNKEVSQNAAERRPANATPSVWAARTVPTSFRNHLLIFQYGTSSAVRSGRFAGRPGRVCQ